MFKSDKKLLKNNYFEPSVSFRGLSLSDCIFWGNFVHHFFGFYPLKQKEFVFVVIWFDHLITLLCA